MSVFGILRILKARETSRRPEVEQERRVEKSQVPKGDMLMEVRRGEKDRVKRQREREMKKAQPELRAIGSNQDPILRGECVE